jgi:hypothetical protein
MQSIENVTFMKKLIRYLALVPLTLLMSAGIQAGTYSNDFNTEPTGLIIRPHSKWVASGGVGGTGYLSLTDAVNDQNQAGVILPNLDPGAPIVGFNAQFKLRMGGGTASPADGFSFSFVPETHPVVTATGGIGEEGPAGALIVVSFDSWDNGGGDTAPAIRIKANDQVLASQSLHGVRALWRVPAGPLLRDEQGNLITLGTGNDFADVEIELACGNLNVTYKGIPVFRNVVVPFAPSEGRFVFGARTGGANNNHWIDDLEVTTTAGNRLFVSKGEPLGSTLIRLGQPVAFEITDAPTGGSFLEPEIRPAGEALQLRVNGVSVPWEDLVFTYPAHPVDPTITVTRVEYLPAGGWAADTRHDIELTFSDGNEEDQYVCTVTKAFSTTFITAGTLFIEAEDFNYRNEENVGGNYFDFGSPAGSYNNLAAVHQVDYFQNNDDGASPLYRIGEIPNVPMVDIGGDRARGETTIAVDYKIGWNSAGEWYNYTRTFPDAVYKVYARISSDAERSTMRGALSEVTSDRTQPDQTLVQLGTFTAPKTMGWDTFTFVPLRDAVTGEDALVRLSGERTVRYTIVSPDHDINYLAFVPTGVDVLRPAVTSLSPNPLTSELPGQAVVPGQLLRAVISDRETAVDASSIKIYLDGEDVTAGATITDTGSGASVEYQLPETGAVVTRQVRLEWNDNSAPGVPGEFSWSFTEGVLSRGFVLREFYGNQPFPLRTVGSGTEAGGGIGGGDAAAWNRLVNHYSFPLSPQFSCYTNIWELNSFDVANDYGSRMTAWFVAPADGEYTFWLSADDHARLYLSTDANPANKVEIARVPGWTARREFAHPDRPVERYNQPINLVAGQRYYMETIHKEGGGGDNVAVYVQVPGGPPAFNGTMPTSGAFFEALVTTPGASLEITQNPESQTVMASGSVTMSAAAQGNNAPGLCGPSLHYQWRRNGVDIVGANGPTYTIPFVAMNHAGTYDVAVSVLGATQVSSPAILTVTEDVVPPVLLSARGGPGNRVVLTFSEPLDTTSLETFEVSIDGGALATQSLTWSDGGKILVAITAPQTPGQVYTVTMIGGTDRAGLGFEPGGNTATFTALASRSGELLREWYYGIGGTSLNNLTNHAKFPNNPDLQDFITLFSSPQTSPDRNDYGVRVTGYIVPPETGNYIFHVHSDDSSMVRLSTDLNPANLRVVVREDGCCTERTGAPFFLEAGVPYYVEALMKEGGGGDYLHVRWTTPSGVKDIIQGENVIFYAVDINTVNLTITQHPVSQTVQQSQSVTFTANATANAGFQRQWQVSRDDGATWENLPVMGSTLTIQFPTIADHHNNLYRLRASLPLVEAFSDAARLTVTDDTVAPTVRYAVSLDSTRIAVLFSEPMHPESGDAWSFELSGGLTVGVATVNSGNPTRIDLTLAEGNVLTLGQSYTLTINGNAELAAVRDTSGNMLAATTVSFRAANMGDANPNNIPALPTDTMLPLDSLAERGFKGRIIQNPGISTDNTVTEMALAGLLPQPNTRDHEFIETGIINYDQEGNNQGRIPGDVTFPGFSSGDHNNLAMEVLTYLELRAGVYRMGVNSDDGFRVTPATSVNDPNQSIVLGEFNGGRGASDTIFSFRVLQDGLYPFRLIWQEGAGGANLEWWILDLTQETTTYIPVNANDLIKAFLPPVPPEAPELNIGLDGENIVISWDHMAGFVLQSADSLTDPDWQNVTAEVTVEGGVASVSIASTGAEKYFRLVRP